MEITLIALIVASGLLGFVTARWWAVAIAVVLILAFYVGLDSGWWGNGTGDGWEYAMLGVTIFAAVITGAAVAAGRLRRG
ncbi:MAG: hypothetical protein ACRDPC_24935 [Solirubrobacteraceae bacterium]